MSAKLESRIKEVEAQTGDISERARGALGVLDSGCSQNILDRVCEQKSSIRDVSKYIEVASRNNVKDLEKSSAPRDFLQGGMRVVIGCLNAMMMRIMMSKPGMIMDGLVEKIGLLKLRESLLSRIGPMKPQDGHMVDHHRSRLNITMVKQIFGIMVKISKRKIL